jgi:polyvinyl alcohol dehydrogenase (cytochrome)
VHAVDLMTGDLRWTSKVDDHEVSQITGAPTLHEGRLYVPVASLEEVSAADPRYECCTFRGSVVALDAATGERVWKTFVVQDEPARTRVNAAGAQNWGPSGAGIWSAPTLDPGRNLLYVATGDAYSDPAAPESDAIVALTMDTGEIRWVQQTTPGDAFTVPGPFFAARRADTTHSRHGAGIPPWIRATASRSSSEIRTGRWVL